MRTAENLVVQALRAIIIAKVESNHPVLVLDYKLNSHIAGPGAHGFQLERSIVAREHATGIVAGVIDEATSFLWIETEASAKYPGRLEVSHLISSPLCWARLRRLRST